MAIKGSGTLSFTTDIVGEYNGTSPHSLSEYYRNGAYVPDNAGSAYIPTSGQINFSDFYGAEAITYTRPYARYNVAVDSNNNAPFYEWVRVGPSVYEMGSGYDGTPWTLPSGCGVLAYLSGESATNMIFFTGHYAADLNGMEVDVSPYVGSVYGGWTDETIGGLNMTLLRGESFGSNWYNTVNNANVVDVTFIDSAYPG